jgi:disulfide bond formation protein DsbB
MIAKTKWHVLLSLLAVVAVLLAACGSSGPPPAPTSRGDVAAGKTKYESTCITCHGPDAKGLPNLGKDLTASEFAKGLSDDDLVVFVTKGRDPSDPANTTGVAMPPKGGNPALTDQDLFDIIAYVRTLEK